jgi:hypothetical protein
MKNKARGDGVYQPGVIEAVGYIGGGRDRPRSPGDGRESGALVRHSRSGGNPGGRRPGPGSANLSQKNDQMFQHDDSCALHVDRCDRDPFEAHLGLQVVYPKNGYH